MHCKMAIHLMVAAATLVARPALSGDLSFTMINYTNQPIIRLWTSPTTSSYWNEAGNVYVPRNGGRQRTTFDSAAYGSDCYQDLKIQFQGGVIRTIEHIYLCGVSSIAIDVNRSGQVTYAAN